LVTKREHFSAVTVFSSNRWANAVVKQGVNGGFDSTGEHHPCMHVSKFAFKLSHRKNSEEAVFFVVFFAVFLLAHLLLF